MFRRDAKHFLPYILPPQQLQDTVTRDTEKKHTMTAYVNKYQHICHHYLFLEILESREARKKSQSVYNHKRLNLTATKKKLTAANKQQKKAYSRNKAYFKKLLTLGYSAGQEWLTQLLQIKVLHTFRLILESTVHHTHHVPGSSAEQDQRLIKDWQMWLLEVPVSDVGMV